MSANEDNPVIAEAQARQWRAADPRAAAFVSAHAGSGKTHVLTGRVIRLLLEGVDPQRILCLTYTRAAAAEMKTRIFSRLAEWIDLDDADLRRAIFEVTGGEVRFDADESLNRPRRLFARALETPGGLKVQTIHAFCERLLKAFPVEAGLPPGFEVMEEARARELVTEARRMVLAGTAPLDDTALERVRRSLDVLIPLAREDELDERLSDLLAQRHRLRPFLDDPDLLDAWRAVLADRLGVVENEDPEEAWHARLDRDLLRRGMALLERHPGKTNDTRRAAFAALLESADARRSWELGHAAFLKKDGEPLSDRSFFTGKVAADDPALADALRGLRDAFHAHVERAKGGVVLEANMALLSTGIAVLHAYEALKAREGLVDYDDLIARTLHLLDPERGDAAWVLYRLDGGIDHVLVDEAQDTSPEQWEIVRRLTAEFCAGSGAHEERGAHLPRTVFAVGDYKQSIYSFQGAEPEVFRRMQEHYAQCFENGGLAFRAVEMDVSFRSAPVILRAVDEVLRAMDPPLPQRGGAHRSAWGWAPGVVELWTLTEPPEKGEADPFTPPRSAFSGESAKLRLANRMAAEIHRLVQTRVPVRAGPEGFRPVRYGDVLILLRSRGDFLDIIIGALKAAGIPVAGADRLVLPEHLAVRDMLALLRFLANREDDFSLACVLKSPLLSRDDGAPIDDDDLLALTEGLAAGEGKSLWRRLREAANAGAPYGQAVARLEQWWNEAGFSEPFSFLSRVLSRDGGRRRFIARLGMEAVEPLDALLDMARAYEREHGGAPAGFPDWLETAAPEIRRELDTGDTRRDEVRVMTVHGAKGLEAPVVFLPDTGDDPESRGKLSLIRVPLHADENASEDGAARAGIEIPFWPLKSDLRNAAAEALVDDWLKRQAHEHHRLLYVAMTRARDRLYIAGFLSGNQKRPPRRSWYETVRRALFPDGEDDAGAFRDETDALAGWRREDARGAPTLDVTGATPEVPPLPAWGRRPPETAIEASAWLAPSRLSSVGAGRGEDVAERGGEPPALSPLSGPPGGERRRFMRGRLVHRLLELLPDVAPEARERRALAWLRHPPQSLSEAEAAALWTEVRRILDDPNLAPLFGPESRAEVPFAARLDTPAGPRMVSGQIDRLVVMDDAVIVADYKTIRPAPRSVREVPEAYVAQLALYARAMRALWPDRTVRALLIFTAAPAVIEIPPERLTADAALQRR